MATMDTLNALAEAVPTLNKKAQTQARASQGTQLQASVGGSTLPAGTSAVRAAQAVAPAAVDQQTAATLKAGEQTQQQVGALAQTGLATQAANDQAAIATQAQDQQKRLADAELKQKLELARADTAMKKKVTGAEMASSKRLQKMGIELDNKLQIATLRQREQLNKLGGNVKDEILDKRMQFERDDMGRKFGNERQLADYAIMNANSELEFQDRMRESTQAHDRKIQMLEHLEKSLRQQVEHGWLESEQKLDNESKARMIEAANALREKIRKDQARAAQNAMMWQAGGTIVGAAAGAVIGTTVAPGVGTAGGAMMGASVGGAAGTAVGGMVSQ